MRIFIFLFLIITSNIYSQSQCDWYSFFPFNAGDSKFDIARIKSTNSTVADREDEYGLEDIVAQTNNRYEKFDYLKDSVYLRVINLRFVNNDCVKGTNSRIQVTLSDDKLHKGTVELEYANYDIMKKQYDELLTLVPERYGYTIPFNKTNRKTNEKIGEGIWFLSKPKEVEGDKLNRIGISYEFNFKKVWDSEKRELHVTNEIESYIVEIEFIDLRQTKLTRRGY